MQRVWILSVPVSHAAWVMQNSPAAPRFIVRTHPMHRKHWPGQVLLAQLVNMQPTALPAGPGPQMTLEVLMKP